MKKATHILLLFIALSSYSQGKFRVDYTQISIYDSSTKTWSDWEKGYNTFVANYNDNGDIAHFKANGEKVVYRRISKEIEEDYTKDNEHYQIIKALDEDGATFSFQIFDNPRIGLKMIYSNIMIQFSQE